MRRREFITLLGDAAATWPVAARAQPQASLPLVGLLEGADDPTNTTALQLGLSQSGFVEGKSVTFEYRNANGQYDRLPALAAARLPARAPRKRSGRANETTRVHHASRWSAAGWPLAAWAQQRSPGCRFGAAVL
jgi:hypothetical protein